MCGKQCLFYPSGFFYSPRSYMINVLKINCGLLPLDRSQHYCILVLGLYLVLHGLRCSKRTHALRRPTDATKPDGLEQWAFRRLVCGVQFLLVFSRRQFFNDPRTPTDATKLDNTKHVKWPPPKKNYHRRAKTSFWDPAHQPMRRNATHAN